MTTTLTTVRSELRDVLKDGGLYAISYFPARPNPPVVVIDGGDPYVDVLQEKTFDEEGHEFSATATVRLDVVIIAGTGDSEALRNSLDSMLFSTLVQISTAEREWNVDRVSQPFYQEVAQAIYLSVRVSISTQIDLEEV